MKFASVLLLLVLAFPVAAQSQDGTVAAVEAQDLQTERTEINKFRAATPAGLNWGLLRN